MRFLLGLIAGVLGGAVCAGSGDAQLSQMVQKLTALMAAVAAAWCMAQQHKMLQQIAPQTSQAQTAQTSQAARRNPLPTAETAETAQTPPQLLKLADSCRTRICHIEWRSMLMAEAAWSQCTPQAAYRRWQTGTMKMPPDPPSQTNQLACGALLGVADDAIARREHPVEQVLQGQHEWGVSIEAEHALEEMEAGAESLQQTWPGKKAALQAYESAVAEGRTTPGAEWTADRMVEGSGTLHRVQEYLRMEQPPTQRAGQRQEA